MVIPDWCFSFLRKFFDAYNWLDATQMESYVMLLFPLTDGSLLLFESACRFGIIAIFGVNDWLSGINWLVWTYATNLYIKQVVLS